MRPRSAPAIATGLLRLFCSSPEHESVTGDLIEQYGNGRGRLWYWRQVLAIVALELYRKVARRPLYRTAKISLSLAVALVVVLVALFSILMSQVWFFGLAVLIGILGGVLKFAYENNLIDSQIRDRIGLDPIPVDPTIAEPVHVSGSNDDYRPKQALMHIRRGINTTSVAGEGFEGLPGLMMMIFFVFAFLSLFAPRDNQWFLVAFLAVEIGAAILYILASRRAQSESAQLKKTLHEINTPHRPK